MSCVSLSPSVSLSVCQSVQAHISLTTGANFFNLGKMMAYYYMTQDRYPFSSIFLMTMMSPYHFTQQYTVQQWF